MQYKITENIIRLIKKNIGDARGARASLARKAGLKPQQISAIINGKYNGVEEGNWIRLCNAIPGLREIGEPVDTVGDPQHPLSVTQNATGNVSSTIHQSAIAGPDCSRCARIDEYRLRVQDRLLSEDDPIPMKTVMQILKDARDCN